MKTLQISDYSTIKPYLDYANYEGVNSNFITMMMWSHDYKIEYEIKDNFLIFLMTYRQGNPYFSMPYCKEEYILNAVEYMIDYAKEHNFPFRLELAIEKVTDIIKEKYQHQFLYLNNIESYDYIYDFHSLTTLSGKKNQKRRNHFNAFLKENHNYVYKRIDDEDIDNVFVCLKRWEKEHEDSETTKSEYAAIMYLLFNRHKLNIQTGCIYIDGKMEAFTIGSRMAHDTVDIHVEKANSEIRGLYVAIGKFFLEDNYKDIRYVNREDDMGIPALRKAKQNLHPIKMIKKSSIIEKNFQIREAVDSDLSRIKDLWLNSFCDEDKESTDFYFSTLYRNQDTYVMINNDTLMGVIQLHPYQLSINKEAKDAYFILGVCIDERYQHNGCMSYFLNWIISQDQYHNKPLLLQAYIPAVYKSFNFKERYYQQRIVLNKNKYLTNDKIVVEKAVNSAVLLELYQMYTNDLNGYRIRNLAYYDDYYSKRIKSFKEEILTFYREGKAIGYCLIQEDDSRLQINEFIYSSKDAITDMISYFCQYTKKIIIKCDLLCDIAGNRIVEANMLTNFEIDGDNLYINENY